MANYSGNTKTCLGCGNPFMPQENEDFCFKCRNSSSSKESEIIDYLREHPGVSILEVSRVSRLSTKVLLKMAHEGRFAGLYLNKDFGYPCEQCGKLITFGTYCPECFATLKKEAKNTKSNMFVSRAKAVRAGKAEREKGRTFSSGMQDEISSRKNAAQK